MADDLSDMFAAYAPAPVAAAVPVPPPAPGAQAAPAPPQPGAQPPMAPGERTLNVTPSAPSVSPIADLEAAFAAPPKPKPTTGDITQDVATQAGAGVIAGTTGLIGTPGDLQTMNNSIWDKLSNKAIHALLTATGQIKTPEDEAKFKKLTEATASDGSGLTDKALNTAGVPTMNSLPTSQQTSDALASVAGPLPDPQTPYGTAARAATSMVPLMAAGPEGVLANGLKAGVKRVAVESAVPGLGAQAADSATSDPALKPLAGFVGGAGAGLAVHGAGAAGRAVYNSPTAAKVADLGTFGLLRQKVGDTEATPQQQQIAGNKLATIAQDPAAFAKALNPDQSPPAPGAPNPDQIVPGSQPTTFALTGDQGIGQAERGDRTLNPAPYQQRAQEQNAANLDHFRQNVPDADVMIAPAHMNDQLEQIDQGAEQKISDAAAAVKSRTDSLIPAAQPEATGAALRSVIDDANQKAKKAEGVLHDAVDPDGTLKTASAPITSKVKEVYGGLSDTAQAYIAPAEKKALDLISGYKPTISYREAADLSSNLAADMRTEKATNGATPAYRRMTQLMGGIKDALSKTQTDQSAVEHQEVAAGTRAPANTMAARLQERMDAFNADRQQAAGAGASGGVATTAPGSQGVLPGMAGASEPAASGSGNASGNPSVSGGAGAKARIDAANAATIARKTTFEKGAVGEAMFPGPTKGTYRTLDSTVPDKLFPRGPKGYQVVKAYHDAAGTKPEAIEALQNAATEKLRAKIGPDGMLKPRDLADWKAAHANALRGMDEVSPGFSSKFDNVAKATQAVADASALRKQIVKEYQAGAVGRIMRADSADEVTNRLGTALSSPDRVSVFKRLADATRNNADAVAGLRKGVADAITKKFTSLREAGTSGNREIKPDAYRKVIEDAAPALEQVYTPEQLAPMRAVAANLDRDNRSIDNKASKGPGTAGDLAAAAKSGGGHGHGGGSFLTVALGAMYAGYEHGGPHTAVTAGAAVGGAYLLKTLRSAGIHDVNSLISEALLNPDVARQLVKRASPDAFREQRIADIVKKSIINGPRDDGSDGGGTQTPPPSGPFSPAGRPQPAPIDPSRVDARGRVEPIAPDLPGSRANVARPATPSETPVPNAPLSKGQARILLGAGHTPEGIRSMTSAERASAILDAKDAGTAPAPRLSPDDLKAMGGAMPHPVHDGRTADGRFSTDGDLLSKIAAPELAKPASTLDLNTERPSGTMPAEAQGYGDRTVSARMSLPEPHPEADATHQAILAHEARVHGPDATPPTPPRTRERAPQSLVSFIQGHGGIRDDGGNLKAQGATRFPGLVTKNGIPPDRMRQMAAEAGYLGADTEHAVANTSVSDLLDAVGSHPTYSVHDQDRVQARSAKQDERQYQTRFAAARKDLVDTLKQDHGLQDSDFDQSLLGPAAHHVLAGKDPLDAYELAIRDKLDKDHEASQAARAAWKSEADAIPFFGDDAGQKKLLPGGSTLEKTASWVIRNKDTKEVAMETFDPKKVEHLNTDKYEAVPIGKYLGEINGRSSPRSADAQGRSGSAQAGAPDTGRRAARDADGSRAQPQYARQNRGVEEGLSAPASRRRIESSPDQEGFNFDSPVPAAQPPNRTPFQTKMHALADAADKVAQDPRFGEMPSGNHPAAYDRHRAMAGAVKDIAKASDDVFAELAHVGGEGVEHETAVWDDVKPGLHDDLKNGAAEMRADMRDPDLVGEQHRRPHVDVRDIAKELANDLRRVADTNEWITRAHGDDQDFHPNDLGLLADHVDGIASRLDELFAEFKTSHAAHYEAGDAGALREAEHTAVANAVTAGDDLRAKAAEMMSDEAPASARPETSSALIGPIGGETIRNYTTGQTVKAGETSTMGAMLKRFDISDDTSVHDLQRASHMVLGHILKGRVGDMPVHVVDAAGMNKLAAGRINLPEGYTAGGFYDPITHHIVLLDQAMRDPAEASRLVIHEGLHGAFYRTIERNADAKALVDHIREAALDHHYDNGGGPNGHYGLTNAHEFVSEAFSNPDFQQFLASIPASDHITKTLGLGQKTGSMWDAFTGAVRRILGVRPAQHSLLDAAMRTGDWLDQLRNATLGRPAAAAPPAQRAPASPRTAAPPPPATLQSRLSSILGGTP